MKRILFALLLVCAIGCDTEIKIDLGNEFDFSNLFVSMPDRPVVQYPAFSPEMPVVNLVQALRQSNWLGSENEGSCVHATMIMLFRWQGREDLAELWRANYENGERYYSLASKFDTQGVQYAYTWKKRDVKFLEWACSTRRGCGVTVRKGKHMVMLVHLDQTRACILDNNSIKKVKWVSRRAFLNEWFNANSWAVTPVYAPSPPLPTKEHQ